MTFDESNAQLTEQLTGRQIDHLARVGKELEVVCCDGHVVVLQADINGDIHFKRTDVRIMLPGVDMFGKEGSIG